MSAVSQLEDRSPDAAGPNAVDVNAAWRSALPSPGELRLARRKLHRKAAVIAILTGVSYFVLVIAETALLSRLIAAAVLVFALIALGTSVMHDANHGAFSTRRWVNRTLAYTSDLLGASSWLWRAQHNQLHHANANVAGFDADLELAPWARLAPSQPWKRRYRWQHLYIWPLYGFMPLKNLLVSDLLSIVHARIGQQPLRHSVTPRVVVHIVLGKASHLIWAVAIPLYFNPWQNVLAFYLACSAAVGIALAIIFQLAHCVEDAAHPPADAPRRGEAFIAHQLRTTVNIDSPTPVIGHVFRWLAGGLDHQIEHHLAPSLPHTAYPRVGARFRALCLAHGIDYHVHRSIAAALGSHTRWLRTMGQP